MNKFLQKVAKIFLGLSMVAGVGVAVSAKVKSPESVNATDGIITFSGGSFNSNVITWTDGSTPHLTVKQEKNTGQTAPNSSYVSNPRWYSGNKVTFTPASGVTITSMTITATSNSYATALRGSTVSSGDFGGSGTTVTWSGSASSAFNVVLGGQCRLGTSMSFVYTAGGTTYTITYNANGGSGTMSSTTGTNPAVAACTFTAPSNKVFSYWHTTSSGTGGTTYAVGDTPGSSVALYAIWSVDDRTKVSFIASSDSGTSPLSKGDISFSCNNGVLNNNSEYRLYKNSVTTFSVTGGLIKEITFTGVSGNPASGFGSQTGWSTSGNNGTWTGSSSSVSFTASGAQVRATQIDVYYIPPVTHTVTFTVGQSGYGSVSQSSITKVPDNASITVSGNKVTINSVQVTATPSAQSAQFSYAFSNWGNTTGNITADRTITANFTRTTRSYTVSFNAQGHGTAPNSQTVAYGGLVVEPDDLSAVGYTFGGWYKESSCSNAWNFNTDTVAGTTVLYAKWTVNNYQVSFNLNDHGTSAAPATQTVSYGGTVTEPSAPTDTQYNFVGWYKEQECVNAWDFTNDTVSGTTVLYASWTIKTFTISLVSGSHGSLSGTTTVNYGTTFSVTLVADHGYGLPQSLTGVTMDGSGDILSQVTYSAGSITGPAVTGDVVINASCVLLAKTYNISTTVSNGGTSGGDTSIEDMGGEATVTVAAGSGYKLPDSISVTGASYTYTKSDKYHASISLSNVSLNDPLEEQVEITVTCVQLTSYNISFTNVQHASHSGAETITEDGEATIVITPDSGYYSPESSSVTVTNATKVSWTKATNTLVIRDPEGAVSISYTPDVNTLTGITLSASSGNYELGDPIEMPTVTAHYSHISDQVITEGNYSVSGTYNPYVIGDYVLTISYSYAGHTEDETYTAHVAAAEVETITTWELTSLASLTSTDEFVIVSTNSNTSVALPHNNGTGSAPGVPSVTISNDKITSNVSSDITWNISGNSTNGYVFYPSGTTESWLYITNTNNGVRVGTGDAKHFTIDHNYMYCSETTDARHIGVYNDQDWRCYKPQADGSPHGNISGQTFSYFKKVVTQTGSEDLIRITAEYNGGVKYVGNTVSVSDFLIKKQYNTGNTLTTLTSEEMATVTIVSGSTLTGEDNTVVLRYVEGGIPQTASVSVSAIEVTAELQSVTLVQDSQTVRKNYVFVSGLQWDFTGLSVAIDYDDDDFDLSFDLATLVQNGEATISPAAPSVGVTSFTVSYRYNDEMDISSATVSGITVREDYVTSMSWTGTTASHFKAFSGGQLTAAQVGAWHVTPTFAGAGVGSELSFNQYTLKVGSKVISSLPYTWTSEDDGEELSITYGKDVDGNDFVKTNNTAVANICASINAIDHTEIITPAWEEDIEAYVKVTDIDDVTTGRYLIVYEGDSTHHNAAYDGSLADGSFDANLNFQSVTFDGDNIEIPESDNFYVTITKNTNDYTITSASGVNIGHSTGSNGFNKTGNNTISFNNDGTVNITGSGGIKLQYNYAKNSERFRYYASAQGAVCLYKYVNETIPHEAVTEKTSYANDMDHFDAQKKVVEFAKFMNATMNGTNVCSGTFANLESAWDDVAGKYDELFGASTTLNETELAWAKKMFEYATAAWGSDAEAACVEKAMKTYDFCVSKYDLDAFMSGVRSVRYSQVSPLINIVGEKANSVAIIVIISMVSVTAIGGYFFLKKRKEEN